MSIIQTIRDKGAAIVIGVIALSLIGFLLMDARSGAAKGLFGGNNTTVGTVNGHDIEMAEFNTKVKSAEQQYQNGNRDQVMQNVWEQVTAERIVTDQFEKLGITFTPQELSSTILSEDAPQQLKQAFTDPQTGQYDIEKARQWLLETKKNKDQEQRQMINSQVIEPLQLSSMYAKYTSMIAGSVYVPAWIAAKENDERKLFANISYVSIPYTDVSDNSIKVSDDDVKNYIDENKIRYKQEAGRIISYVSFSTSPNVKDSAIAKATILSLRNNFQADTNAKAFVSRNMSAINFSDAYILRSKIQVPFKDSVIALPDGGIYGPYLDGPNYVLAKKVSTKILPDSIKCRHILIATSDPQTGQPTTPDSIAKRKIDSVQTAIQSGANFDTLEARYSTDKAAHNDKGVMTFDLAGIQGDNFAKPFGDFLLNENGETKKVIKTQFGWHYIEILEKKNPEPAYKVAYLAKEIVPSEETISAANVSATKLSGMARDEKAFEKYIQEHGLNKITAPGVIKENDYSVGGLQDARPIVKWAFNTKEGEVSDEPFSLKDQFIVAVVSKKISAGLPDVKTARPMVETIILNKRKAAEIIKKLNNPATLEAAAGIYKKNVLTTGTDSTLTFNALIISGVGNEPKVAGASFNKDYQAKVSPPISGNTGVFIIKTNSISSKPPDPPAIASRIKSAQLTELIQGNQQRQGVLGSSFNSLKKWQTLRITEASFFNPPAPVSTLPCIHWRIFRITVNFAVLKANFMEEAIINKVADSGLITLDLEDYYPKEVMAAFDLKDYLFMGLILKEKDFREALKNTDWSFYKEKNVYITCTADAVIPMWANMLAATYLEPVASNVIYGNEDFLHKSLFLKNLSQIDIAEYYDKRVVVKGCGDKPIVETAYVEITRLLRPVAKSIMYGEPCSTVPIYKKPKTF